MLYHENNCFFFCFVFLIICNSVPGFNVKINNKNKKMMNAVCGSTGLFQVSLGTLIDKCQSN